MTSPPGTVLHIAPTLFRADGALIGGAERYVLGLVRAMAQRTPTTLLSFGDVAREETVDGLRIRVVTGAWAVRGQFGNPLHPAILQEALRADVVHCHQTHVVASSLTAILRRLGRGRVFTTDLGGGGWDLSAYVDTDSWYDGHLHISEYSRAIFGHLERASARVILGGVDLDRFRPADQEPSRDFVLFVGRLLPHKGVDELIRGMPDDFRLVVAGRRQDQAYFGHLEQLAEGKQVEFRTDVPDDELVELYRNALCLVLPSVYRSAWGGETDVPELLGQTLLEAMACGTPGICTDVASMPEIVSDGENGYIVPPNDPAALAERIESLRNDRALVEEMGARARRDVERRFSWDAVVDRCFAAYRELDRKGKGSRK